MQIEARETDLRPVVSMAMTGGELPTEAAGAAGRPIPQLNEQGEDLFMVLAF